MLYSAARSDVLIQYALVCVLCMLASYNVPFSSRDLHKTELSSRPALLNRVVHVINIEIRDRIEDACIGAQHILALSKSILLCEDLDAEIGETISRFSSQIPSAMLYNVCFY